MKKFTLKIKTENAAFEENPMEEIKRILLDLIDRLDNETGIYMLQDVNGNNVGSADFK